MSNIIEHKPLTADEVVSQVQRIQQIMESVMKEGHHYGEIPGIKAKEGEAKKFVLLKAGAEKLMMTFRISNEIKVEDLSNSDERRYRVKSTAIHIDTGKILGEGIGEASTSEEKFKWREAICTEEFNETLPERRREKWKKGYYDKYKKCQVSPSKIQQIRNFPEDQANTVLKIAKKRALLDMVLTTTAASDIFTQDLEEDFQDQVQQNEFSQEIKKKDPKITEENQSAKCSQCGIDILPSVNEFSQKMFGRSLCMNHQKEAKNAKA